MIEELKAEVSAFKSKYKDTRLNTPETLNAYIADAEKILGKYPSPEGEERREIAKFCSSLGCNVVVFGHELERGIPYYQKSIELDPDSYDLRWGYYTTLEELVDDKECRTPELVQDAIDCLKFCINYCNTPELRHKHHIHYRYTDLGRVYLADRNYKKAANCAKASLKVMKNDGARELLKEAKKGLGFFERIALMFAKIDI